MLCQQAQHGELEEELSLYSFILFYSMTVSLSFLGLDCFYLRRLSHICCKSISFGT